MSEINESTKISLPIKAVWTISIAFLAATVWLMGLYGEVKKVPEDLEAIQLEVLGLKEINSRRDKRDYVNCLILVQLQKRLVPKDEQIEARCE